MTPTIYMIRHGQTDWNAEHRLQGQRNIPMNDTGRAQVKANGEKLRARLDGEIEHCAYVSSPIGRAVKTMHIIRKTLGLPPDGFDTDLRLAEVDYGAFEGFTWDELQVSHPDEVAARLKDPWRYRNPDGESYATLAERVLAWYREIETDTVVTAHGGISRVLRSLFLDMPLEQIPLLDAPQNEILVLNKEGFSWL